MRKKALFQGKKKRETMSLMKKRGKGGSTLGKYIKRNKNLKLLITN
jgi:hypothetical protein